MNTPTSLTLSNSETTLAVITVCRNALEDLKTTVESVRSQSADGIVHVVVDGGSTDGTAEWLRARRNYFAVALSEPDKGIYDAMNKAVKLCPDAKWLIFMNAGDCFQNSDVVASALIDLERDDVDFIFGSVEIREAAGSGRTKIYSARLQSEVEMPGCHQSCFVRMSLMRRLLFNLDYRVAADFECWLRATHEAGSKTGFANLVIATIAPEGFSARNEPTLQQEYVRAISTFLTRRQALIWLAKRKFRRLFVSMRVLLLQPKK